MRSNITRFISWYAQRWYTELQMEREVGISTANSLAFQGIDVFGQTLGSMLSGMYGNGGKGSGFDLSDRKESAAEIKTVCLCQPWRCTKCKKRSPWTSTSCVHCAHEVLEQMNDSRFGIKADAHIKYKDSLKNYYLIAIEHLENSDYGITAWRIDCDNPYFNLYVNKQHESGSTTCNCLPYSYDFYMSGPTRLLKAKMVLNENLKVETDLTEVKEKVPIKCLQKKELKKVSEHVSDNHICYDVAKDMLSIRNKTHGKSRGETTRYL